MTLDTFYLFPHLSVEERLHIWSLSCIHPEPRTVEIAWNNKHNQWCTVRESGDLISLPLSALTNKEALEHYFKDWFLFCPCKKGPGKRAKFPVCRINPKIDTLYIGAGIEAQQALFLQSSQYRKLVELPCIAQIRILGSELI